MEERSFAALFLDQATIQDWKTGSLIRIWTPDTGIYYILEGSVHINRLLKNGSRSIIHVLGKNSLFFENRYFHHHTRTTAVYAAAPTRTAYLAPDVVDRLYATSLEFCHLLIRSMSEKTLRNGKHRVDSNRLCAETRMLAVLHELASAQEGGPASCVHITQVTLADFVGIHPVTANITLKRLEEAGFLRLGRATIELDLPRMEAALSAEES